MPTGLFANRLARVCSRLSEVRPAEVALGSVTGVEAVREGVDLLRRDAGSAWLQPPLFCLYRVDDPARAVTYLGLSGEALESLASLAGDAVARLCQADLAEAIGTTVELLPDDVVGQIAAAAAVLGGPLRLAVMPLGLGPRSGSGIAYSHDPATGVAGLAGSFRENAVGVSLLAQGGSGLAHAAQETRARDAVAWRETLVHILDQAYTEVGWPIAADFIVHSGRLWILGLRLAELRGAPLVEHALEAHTRGDVTTDEVTNLVREADLAAALAPRLDTRGLVLAARGVGVSPGVVSGLAVFSADEAARVHARGVEAILVLVESRPEDLTGILASAGVVAQRGGRSSHAAVIARSLGRPCVAALTDAFVNAQAGVLRLDNGREITAGTRLTVDGTSGLVYLGTPGEQKPGIVDPAFLARLLPESLDGIEVRVNADSVSDAVTGRAAGATGIGLCRTEHMFLGERKTALAHALIHARGPDAIEAASTVQTIMRREIAQLLSAMDGLPVAIRLLDAPRHEFLDLDTAAMAGAEPHAHAKFIHGFHEHNPMFGTRGVRMALLRPELLRAQLSAVFDAIVEARRSGTKDPQPQIVVPMISSLSELHAVREAINDVAFQLGFAEGATIPVGAMVETPRSALLAGDLATACDFLSFGTNDLTAAVWAISRDDAENDLLPHYEAAGLIPSSPFATFDEQGVGRLVRMAIDDARQVNPAIRIGVCGEHAGVPGSVAFFRTVGVDYLSCSPPAVTLVRYAMRRKSTLGSA